MNILSIDPGVSTGLAYELDGIMKTSCTRDVKEVYKNVMSTMTINWDLIIIESFASAGILNKYKQATIEIFGGVKALCFNYSIATCIHAPANKFPFMAQAREILRGKKHEEHEVDALAHLLMHKEEHTIKIKVPNRYV